MLTPPAPLKDKSHLRVRVLNRKITVAVNGAELFTYDASNEDWWNPQDSIIALATYQEPPHKSATFSNLRIRAVAGE